MFEAARIDGASEFAILRRIAIPLALPAILTVTLLTFIIFVKLPAGDPARRAVGRTTTPEQIEAARKAFGLDKPLYVQYGIDPSARIAYGNDGYNATKKSGAMRRAFDKLFKK